MKQVLLFVIVLFTMAVPAMSQFEVPPVTAPDDSLPVLGSVMIDPSNMPLGFHVNGSLETFTEFSLDFSGSSRIAPPTTPTTQTLTGSASVRRGGSGMFKNLPLEVAVQFNPKEITLDKRTYDMEVLSMNISGGTLPGGVMIRESPTLATRGKVKNIRSTGSGVYTSSSFFDIFTELSLDGGATWTPADNSIRLETKVLHARRLGYEPDPGVTPNGVYVASLTGDPDFDLLSITNNTVPLPPAPPVGSTETYTLNARALVLFGGAVHIPSDVVCVVRATGTYADDTTKSFDTEMLQLSLSGGTLPGGVMVRESPTRASTGQARRLPVHNLGSSGQDGVAISSFFDVFIEISTDGGSTWAERTPTTLEFSYTLPLGEVPPVVAMDDSLPVLGSVMIDPSNQPATFRAGSFFDVFTELSLDFSSSRRVHALHRGENRTYPLTGTARFRLSTDGGSTFEMHTCPVDATFRESYSSSSNGTDTFDTEMLQLNISGGTLPGGVMIRESPTLPSLGRSKQSEAKSNTKAMFTAQKAFYAEISHDGGTSWTPADGPIIVEAKIKPTVLINRPDPPAPYPAGRLVGDLDGDGLDDLDITNTVASLQPLGGDVIVHSNACDVRYMYDGLDRLIRNAPYSVRIHHTFDDGSDQYFDTEMLQLDLSGGTLPPSFMLRESPSKASLGRTSIRVLPTGGFEVSSFFDIFTEVTIDGGQTWTPQTPATLAYVDTVDPVRESPSLCISAATYPDDLYPFNGVIVPKPPTPNFSYSNGMRLRVVYMGKDKNTSRSSLPSLGMTQVYGEDNDCDGLIDDASGAGYIDFHSTGPSSVRITHSSDNGEERVFNTEMLQLDLVGNAGGQVVMLRESPSKASLGRTTIRPNGSGFMISSFFDIFTELSVDGGQTWFPSAESVRVEQELLPQAHEFASSNFPPPGVYDMMPACASIQFENGALLRLGSFFDIFADVALPPAGGSSTNTATGRSRQSVSLDGGNSFFDVFTEVSMSVRCDATSNTPTDRFFDTEMLSLDLTGYAHGTGGTFIFKLRESPSRPSVGQTKLRESPTRMSSFFDVFTELSLDGGQTWSPALTPMRVELDSVTNGSISGMKWHDVNGNGVNDGETGLANWKIVLTDTLGTIIDTVRTIASGDYSFPNVPFGTYRVYEELKPDWIQTGGSPAYGFNIAPGQADSGFDFGNFHAPILTGYKFNDRNNNGTRDGNEEGLKDWEICLSPSNNPNPDIDMSSATGTFGMRLNGLPPGVPVTGTISGGVHVKWSRTNAVDRFENGDIPTEMLALDLHGTGQSSSGFFDVSFRRLKSAQNHLVAAESRGWDGTIKGNTKLVDGRVVHDSFFDIFIECIVSPRDAASGLPTGKRMHGAIVLTGYTTGINELLPFGTLHRSGQTILFDDDGLEAGTLDSLTFTVGEPVSQANPVCAITDEDGQYSFAPLLPGTWSVTEHSQPGWTQSSTAPSPIVVTSGAMVTPIDFGNFRLSDTLKYRTFTYEQLRDISQEKTKKVPSNKIPNSKQAWYAPNTANLIEKILKDETGFMQVGQSGKLYPWGKAAPYLRPMKQGEVWKTFNDKKTPYHVNPPGGPQPMNYNNKGGIISGWKKSISPKDKNDVLIAELLTLQVNLEASDKHHTTFGLGNLVYTWPGPWGQGVTIDSLASYGDKIMTNGIIGMIMPMPVNPIDYDSLYNAVRRINLAFASPVLDDTTGDGGWRGSPMKFKWKGTHTAYEYPFLIAVPGIVPRIRSTPEPEQLPMVFALNQNYPNPFNPTTMISFGLPEPAIVTLKVYNVLGQELVTLLNHESMEAGAQEIEFNASNFPSGVYFYQIAAQGITNDVENAGGKTFITTRKMLLVK